MKRTCLAALIVLLIAHGASFAQQDNSDRSSNSSPDTPAAPQGLDAASTLPAKIRANSPYSVTFPTPVTGSGLPPGLYSAGAAGPVHPTNGFLPARPPGFWVSAEPLLWWFKSSRVPPLITAGGNGVPGTPGTHVALDSLGFDDAVRPGGRFRFGYNFESMPNVGFEVNYFFVGDRQSNAQFASGGNPVLGRPYLDLATGMPAANLFAFPGAVIGSATVAPRSWLWGMETNLTTSLIDTDTFHLGALGGFRFLSLDDELSIGEPFYVKRNVPGFGGSLVGLHDGFRGLNNFYGGQLGLESGLRFGRLTIDVRGKVALGDMHQVVDVAGATNVLGAKGSTAHYQGGLLALRSNIGQYSRDVFAVIPELGLNVGWQLTPELRVFAGYTVLWINNVARAGEQIDPVVNTSQFPILSGNHPLVGAPRPAFHFHETDFWAQGVNFGVELRF